MMNRVKRIDFPVIHDERGNLSFIENSSHIPFDMQRVYYLYDVPGGSERGGHAHKELQQVIIAMSGSFDIVLDDGFERMIYQLNRSSFGLYIPVMIWRELNNFSLGAVCLVLASSKYDEKYYIRDYNEFIKLAREIEHD